MSWKFSTMKNIFRPTKFIQEQKLCLRLLKIEGVYYPKRFMKLPLLTSGDLMNESVKFDTYKLYLLNSFHQTLFSKETPNLKKLLNQFSMKKLHTLKKSTVLTAYWSV